MKTTGMVLGKFYPPHKGHEFLLRFAQRYCDELFIIVGSLKSESISGARRVAWLEAMFPESTVLHLEKELPQKPEEDPRFWEIWKAALGEVLPCSPDLVFTTENYGAALAKHLDAKWIAPDRNRKTVDISATKIREDPVQYWSYLNTIVRPYFRKKIVICGPESAGKTTLTKQLGIHYCASESAIFENTVREFARHYLEKKSTSIAFSDMEIIARGQEAAIEALAFDAGPFLFCDTDSRATRLWSHALFGKSNSHIDRIADRARADLYLLCRPDIAYEPDPIRYLPGQRQAFFDATKTDLQGMHVVEIFGDFSQRFEQACQSVDALSQREFLSPGKG